MEYCLKIGDLISLEDDSYYQVLDSADVDDAVYHLVVQIAENPAEMLDPRSLKNALVQEIIEDGAVYVEQVTDEILYDRIKSRIIRKRK